MCFLTDLFARRSVARQDFPSYAFSNTTSPELWLGTLGIAPMRCVVTIHAFESDT